MQKHDLSLSFLFFFSCLSPSCFGCAPPSGAESIFRVFFCGLLHALDRERAESKIHYFRITSRAYALYKCSHKSKIRQFLLPSPSIFLFVSRSVAVYLRCKPFFLLCSNPPQRIRYVRNMENRKQEEREKRGEMSSEKCRKTWLLSVTCVPNIQSGLPIPLPNSKKNVIAQPIARA